MDKKILVLAGLPLLLALFFFNVLVVPSSKLAVELRSKCLHALGYLAVSLTWVILLWEWVINPATKLYRLLAKIIDQASGAVSEWSSARSDTLGTNHS
ncbi:MAG: hypothetical protein Q9181_006096 [Wetmoreana brouardii]